MPSLATMTSESPSANRTMMSGMRKDTTTAPVRRRDAAAGCRVPASLAQVHEAGDAVPRGDPEHLQDLLSARTRRVGDPEADAERAIGHALLDQGVEPRQVRRRERAVRPAARG